MLHAIARTVIAKFDNFDGLLQQAVHLLPANVFKEGFPQSSALARVSSLETVTDELLEKNQDLQESLEGEAKKRTKEVKKVSKYFFNILFLSSILLGNAV